MGRVERPAADLVLLGPEVAPERRLPNNLHVSIPGFEGDRVAGALCDVALSSRSACTSSASGPSHVVAALAGCTEDCTTLRFGVGRCTTAAEIDYVVERLAALVPTKA